MVLRSWTAVREALRHKDLRQNLYDEGALVMGDCLLNLHGSAHRDRRRLENRLFRRETFQRWERELLEPTVTATLAPFVVAGEADLVVVGYQAAMNLTAHVAGIDHDPGDPLATERLYEMVRTFSAGATIAHSTRDKAEVRAEVAATLDRFEVDLLAPSRSRRLALLSDRDDGRLVDDDLPRDVLTTVLQHSDRLSLDAAAVRREIAFYLQAGAHSTANAFVHAVDAALTWGVDHPEDLALARRDVSVVQRCVHEALRLHPASPVASRQAMVALTLGDVDVAEGTTVLLDLAAANRDRSVWGADADEFDPWRVPPARVSPWGLSFGAGMHTCIGQELDGGFDPAVPVPEGERLYGTVAVIAHAVLAGGARLDPSRPPVLDPTSTRTHFSHYPVLLGGS